MQPIIIYVSSILVALFMYNLLNYKPVMVMKILILVRHQARNFELKDNFGDLYDKVVLSVGELIDKNKSST